MKIIKRFLLVVVLVIGTALVPAPARAAGTTFYVDNANPGCSDSGPGTSTGQPWCTLARVTSGRPYGAGDSILLARGRTWAESLDLTGSGTAAAPITVAGYGSGDRPKITNGGRAGYGIRVTNSSYWAFRDLELDGAGANKLDAGLQAVYGTIGHQGLTLSNLYVHHTRLGIAITGQAAPAVGEWGVKGVVINNVEGTHNETSIALGNATTTERLIQNVTITAAHLHHDDGAPAPEGGGCPNSLTLQSATEVLVTNSLIDGAGGCPMATGTTGVYLGHVAKVTLLNNLIVNTKATGSPDQTGIDYEAGTTDVAVRGNYLGGNAGWGVEVLTIHPSPGGDHRGVAIDANSFANNVPGIARLGSEATATGTIDRNLWTSSGLTFHDGATFDGMIIGGQAPNPGPVTSDRIWYAARDFSTGQGTYGWRFEHSTNAGASWSPLTYIPASGDWRPAAGGLPQAGKWTWHPGGGSAYVAKAWTAPAAGTIAITGQAAKGAVGGDGIRVRVLRTSAAGTTTVLGPTAIGGADRIGRPTSIDALTVAQGDVIRFVVDAGAAGENSNDTTNWTPAIGYL
ncbi:right-handed parallel beta-helix repeat-containing protein [Microlunatus sp. GCM10028923]|uniref:right-handed parallel beta-helix repeat-containing protein n=1 Tax=Microlunatus sp. GCM10028923 TaxID=3273400 RepID=UPI0036140674